MSWGTLGFSGGSAKPIAPAMDTQAQGRMAGPELREAEATRRARDPGESPAINGTTGKRGIIFNI